MWNTYSSMNQNPRLQVQPQLFQCKPHPCIYTYVHTLAAIFKNFFLSSVFALLCEDNFFFSNLWKKTGERERGWTSKMRYNIKQILNHNTIARKRWSETRKREKKRQKKKNENHQIKKGNKINGQNYEKLKRCWFKYCCHYSASNGVINGFTKRLEIMMALFYTQCTWFVYVHVCCVCVCVCVCVCIFCP